MSIGENVYHDVLHEEIIQAIKYEKITAKHYKFNSCLGNKNNG
jgi:hypothetical protein